MEKENLKKNGFLLVLVIVLFLIVIVLGGYIVYDKVLSKTEKSNNESVSNNVVGNNTIDNKTNINTTSDNNKSDYSEIIKNATVSYEDDKYIAYSINDVDDMCIDEYYIVYDKTNKKYINDSLNMNSKISYFGKVLGEYYYFEEYWVNNSHAATNIYNIDGTLIVNKPNSFDRFISSTNTFKFSNCPVTVITDPDSSIYEWSPED